MSKDVVLQQHAFNLEYARGLVADLSEAHMPSRLAMLTFMAVTHEALHLGQLAAWRRSQGLPQAMGGL